MLVGRAGFLNRCVAAKRQYGIKFVYPHCHTAGVGCAVIEVFV